MEYVWLALAVAVMALFTWVGFRIEPHWVAKDLSRFIGNAQLMTDKGEPVGRFRETRVLIEPNGEMLVDQRRFMRRRDSNVFRLMAESDAPPRGRVVFLLRGHSRDGTPALLAMRVPSRSKIVPRLRQMLAATPTKGTPTKGTPTKGTPTKGTPTKGTQTSSAPMSSTPAPETPTANP